MIFIQGWLASSCSVQISECVYTQDKDTGKAKAEAKNNRIVALPFGSFTVSGAGYEAGD